MSALKFITRTVGCIRFYTRTLCSVHRIKVKNKQISQDPKKHLRRSLNKYPMERFPGQNLPNYINLKLTSLCVCIQCIFMKGLLCARNYNGALSSRTQDRQSSNSAEVTLKWGEETTNPDICITQCCKRGEGPSDRGGCVPYCESRQR